MGLLELFLIAVGLSMDAFAVSIGKGLAMKKVRYGDGLVIALFFGVFQAGMPVIGYLLGARSVHLIEQFDHWIAFLLLAAIGGNMIREAVRGGGDPEAGTAEYAGLDLKELIVLAIATSIDALAVGFTFAILPGIALLPSITLIGVTTFVISFGGVLIGHAFGRRFEDAAQILGGIILIGIGIKILTEHLGLLPF